jgi:transposase
MHSIDAITLIKKNTMEKQQQTEGTVTTFEVKYAHAAGIDCGSKEHVVAIGQDKEKDVTRYGVFTSDLRKLAQYLRERGITHVALESTAYYWQRLYAVLLEYGMDVYLAQPAHIKNPADEKTDTKDARWIQKLLSCGMIKHSFQPDKETLVLRNLVRERKSLLQLRSRSVNKMNKQLVLMNIRLDVVQSRTNNLGCLKIIEAIVKGERNAQALLQLFPKTGKQKADKYTKLEALEGIWNEEHIFNLKLLLEQYQFYNTQITVMDAAISSRLDKMIDNNKQEEKKYVPVKKKPAQKNDIAVEALRIFYQLTGGVDASSVFGVGNNLLLTLISETGVNLKERFACAAHFVSWLHLSPNNKITGGKVIKRSTRRFHNPLKTALRDAAKTMHRSPNQLGDFYRRIRYRKGEMCAITATARKLAVILYHMITRCEQFKLMAS